MLVDIHTHSPSKEKICIKYIRNLSTHKDFYFSTGIHPWDAHLFDNTDIEQILNPIISHPNFTMLSDIGIDLVKKDNLDSQRTVFRQQLEYAKKKNLKIILIHSVRAFNEVLKILKETGYDGSIIFHDANFNLTETEQIIKLGYFLSFGKNLFKENSKASQTIHTKWLDHYFFETDESSKSIAEVYQQASSAMDTSVTMLEQRILKNFHKLPLKMI